MTDIELPAEVKHRSGGHVILLIPGQSQEITEEEWAFIKANHPDAARQVDELNKPASGDGSRG
jgi:hypothetical protein